jgi:hypothetical protein
MVEVAHDPIHLLENVGAHRFGDFDVMTSD